MDPVVIGQGSFGCVHKPSLKCKDETGISYVNKVSKILSKPDAKKEIGEYSKVSKADKKNQFYLGKPEDCEVDESQFNVNAIRKCTIGDRAAQNLDRYQLILMENGGENLVTYTDKMRNWSRSEMSTENCEKFAIEALRLFAGLKTYLDKGLVHFDLKPQNIVYNATTNRLNFIDFGMMKSKKPLISQAKKSKCGSAFFHWSYPWELKYVNRNWYDAVTNSKTRQDAIIADLKNKYGSNSVHLGHFFAHVLPKNLPDAEYQEKCNEYIDGFAITIRNDMKNMGYDGFVNKVISTIDLFGVGMAMNYWFAVAKRHLDPAFAFELANIFKFMISPLISTRYTIDELITDYEGALRKSGLLQKYDKEIVDHIAVNGLSAHKHRTEKPAKVIRIKKVDQAFVNADPAPCPPGKEINPKTGRCIKFKPVKDLAGPCPPGKERNPATGRCIKIKESKAAKNGSRSGNVLEACPAGKERNPKTRRCVNKCKDGYSRDTNFKCTRKKRS